MANPPTAAVRLAGLRVWASRDGGGTWTPAKVTPGPRDTYQVHVQNPTAEATTSGRISLQVQAWDRAGNSVRQTITDAYVLKP